MKNIRKLPDLEVRGRRNAPTIVHNPKIKKTFLPRRFDAVAFAAVLEVLG